MPFLIMCLLFTSMIIWIINIYNNFIESKKIIDQELTHIQLKCLERFAIISKLDATFFQKYNKSIVNDLLYLNMDSKNKNKIIEKDCKFEQLIKLTISEINNRKELVQNNELITFKNELLSIQSQIKITKEYYNALTRSFNSNIEKFPTNIFAHLVGINKIDYINSKDI